MVELYNEYRMKMFKGLDIPITAIKTTGTRIKTREYGELIDLQSGCWAAVLGHNRKEILEALTENMKVLFHLHEFFDTEHPGALIRELIKAASLKCSYKGTFMSSGSEAVSLAVVLSEFITGKKRKLSFSISYLGASPELKIPRDSKNWMDLDITQCLNCKKDLSCKECGKFSHIDFSQMAAFVFEPGNSGGLVLCPPEKLIKYLSKEIREKGGFVIANEVTTGFGRTGKWFGFQHYDYFNSELTSPDFIALGKGLGNGYPISGILVRPRLADIIESNNFRYVQSHTDDPLGCIVGRKVIEVMVNENLVEHGSKMGEYLRNKLCEIKNKTCSITEIRGRGMMNVLVLDNEYKASEVFISLLNKGYFTAYSELHNFIHLYPPITVKMEDIDNFCSSLESILG